MLSVLPHFGLWHIFDKIRIIIVITVILARTRIVIVILVLEIVVAFQHLGFRCFGVDRISGIQG